MSIAQGVAKFIERNLPDRPEPPRPIVHQMVVQQVNHQAPVPAEGAPCASPQEQRGERPEGALHIAARVQGRTRQFIVWGLLAGLVIIILLIILWWGKLILIVEARPFPLFSFRWVHDR